MTSPAAGVRRAVRDDIEPMRAVERAAGEAFRGIGLAEIADDEPLSVDELAHWVDAGRAWVATVGDTVAGYVIVDVVDDHDHIAQVSVAPRHQGSGLGRQLLDSVAAWAEERSLAGLSLTTFRDVPWNAPLYAHLGFSVVEPGALSPGLTALVAAEASAGLAVAPRVAMRRDL